MCKELRRLEKIQELWKLYDNNKNNPKLQRNLLVNLGNNTILLNRFYDLLSVMERQPIEFYESLKNGFEDEDENNDNFHYKDEDNLKEKIVFFVFYKYGPKNLSPSK